MTSVIITCAYIYDGPDLEPILIEDQNDQLKMIYIRLKSFLPDIISQDIILSVTTSCARRLQCTVGSKVVHEIVHASSASCVREKGGGHVSTHCGAAFLVERSFTRKMDVHMSFIRYQHLIFKTFFFLFPSFLHTYTATPPQPYAHSDETAAHGAYDGVSYTQD